MIKVNLFSQILRKMGIDSQQKLESDIISNIHTSDDIRNRDLATKYENTLASMREKPLLYLRNNWTTNNIPG